MKRARHPIGWFATAAAFAMAVVASSSRHGGLPGEALGPAIAVAAQAQAQTPARPPSPATAVKNPHGDIRIACEVCHTPDGWTSMRVPSAFDHAVTGFPLVGRHRSAACGDCHASSVFSRVATSCVDCHRDVHEGRNGLRCDECHSPERWVLRADAIREHAATGFPLVGVHALVECTRCHGNTGEGVITRVSSQCAACHAAQYAAATSPDHAASGFPTQCETCHSPARTAWTGARFDHAFTGFPLTGAHRALQCAACHTAGGFAGLSGDCFACHQAEYVATSNPSHATAGFGTQCASCHTTNAWQPATFDHDRFFRIYSGRHRELWTSCAQCHQNPGNYSDFTCLQCHGQTDTDPRHREVTGYRYESSACYACHRDV